MNEFTEKGKEVVQSARVPVPNTSLPFIGHVDSLALKQLICGAIAGGVSGVVAAPFEFLRSKAIAGKGGGSVVEVFRETLAKEGWRFFIKKGNLLSGINRNALQRGIMFCTYEAVKRREEKNFGEDLRWLPSLPKQVPVSTVAGALAALASTLVTYPLSVVGDRMFLAPDRYNSLSHAMLQIATKEGVSELYRGLVTKAISMVPEGAASFFTYEALKQRYLEHVGKKDLDAIGSLLCGAAAGLVSTTLTYPMENVRSMMSMKGLPKGAKALKTSGRNATHTMMEIISREGIGFSGMYRGVLLRYAEIIPMTAISFAVYELCKRVLIARHKEQPHEVKG